MRFLLDPERGRQCENPVGPQQSPLLLLALFSLSWDRYNTVDAVFFFVRVHLAFSHPFFYQVIDR